VKTEQRFDIIYGTIASVAESSVAVTRFCQSFQSSQGGGVTEVVQRTIAIDSTDNIDSTVSADRGTWTSGGQSHEKTLNSGGIVEPAQSHQYRWAYLLLTVGYCFNYIWSQFEASDWRLLLTLRVCIV
jgi:hypothetical protein